MKREDYKIFIVEDDRFYAQLIQTFLMSEFGFKHVSIFEDGQSCLDALHTEPTIVVLDYFLGLDNGHEILKSIKETHPNTRVVMLSGQEYLNIAVKSYKYGAYDYIEKNKDSLTNLGKVVNRILTNPIHVKK